MFDSGNMKVSRRRFLGETAALTGAIVGGCTSAPKQRGSEIMTVRGPIAPEEHCDDSGQHDVGTKGETEGRGHEAWTDGCAPGSGYSLRHTRNP